MQVTEIRTTYCCPRIITINKFLKITEAKKRKSIMVIQPHNFQENSDSLDTEMTFTPD